MKANVNGIEVEGTPAELAALIREMNLPAGTAIPYGGGMKEAMVFVKMPLTAGVTVNNRLYSVNAEETSCTKTR